MTYFESILPQLMQSFQLMGQGMLGIFIVIAAITGVTTLLNTVTSGMGKKKDDDE